jgi:hypothetical protein
MRVHLDLRLHPALFRSSHGVRHSRPQQGARHCTVLYGVNLRGTRCDWSIRSGPKSKKGLCREISRFCSLMGLRRIRDHNTAFAKVCTGVYHKLSPFTSKLQRTGLAFDESPGLYSCLPELVSASLQPRRSGTARHPQHSAVSSSSLDVTGGR